MNLLAFRFNDLYMSLTLFYGGLVMASNMIWGHEIVHYYSMGKYNKQIYFLLVVFNISYCLDNDCCRRLI